MSACTPNDSCCGPKDQDVEGEIYNRNVFQDIFKAFLFYIIAIVIFITKKAKKILSIEKTLIWN